MVKGLLLFFVLVFLSGCGMSSGPRGRIGSYAAATAVTNFMSLADIGEHGGVGEGNGQVYTCRAGHIDLAHARKSADYTRYFAEKIFGYLMESRESFTLKMKEPSRYMIRIVYPDNWNDLPQEQRERIAWDVSLELGQYAAYTGSTWHEMITWYGYTSAVIISETNSTFAWEDGFSNLFGSYVAKAALKKIASRSYDEYLFNRKMTSALSSELKELGIQSASVAREASRRVDGLWYSKFLIYVKMKKMHLDIGYDDGYVTGWVIAGVGQCGYAEAKPYPVPKLDDLNEYGFSVSFEIEPRCRGGGKILDIANKAVTIEPKTDFPLIIDNIRETAAIKYKDPDVDKPFEVE